MRVTLDEMKQYLRVDYEDDDVMINDFISAGERLCLSVARLDDLDEFYQNPCGRIAVMFVVAYLYEHREEADHKSLSISLRSLLSDVRREGF